MEKWVFALDLDVLARVVGTSRRRLVAHLFPEEEEEIKEEEEEEEIKSSSSSSAAVEGGVAVITAARRPPKGQTGSAEWRSTPKELLEIGGQSVLIHSLRSLERARFDAVIVLVGYRGEEIRSHIESFRRKSRLEIEILNLGDGWSGTHAESILRAKPAVERLCGPGLSRRPALLVTSDHLFDPSLLDAVLRGVEGDALLVEGELHDQLKDYLLPSTAVRARTVLVSDDDVSSFWCERVGRRVEDHDAFDAGLVRLGGPRIFDALERLARNRHRYFALCEALDALARKNELRAVFADKRPWFAVETEEQLESTRVLLASPSFQDKVPFEVHYKKRPPRDSTNGSLAAYVRRERRYLVAPVAGGALPPKTSVSLPYDDALLAKVDADKIVALVPEDDDAAAAAAMMTPAAADADDVDDEPACATLLASTGIEDVDDIQHLKLRANPPEKMLEVLVERRVPLIGWVILGTATALQASAAIVFDRVAESRPPPEKAMVTFWRPLAASLCVLPLVAARRAHTRTSAPPERTARYYGVLIVCAALQWLMGSSYLLAFDVATSPNDVVLVTSLAPLAVVLARLLRLYGAAPSRGEVLGTLLGLSGAFVCGANAPPSSSSSSNATENNKNARPLLAAALGALCVAANACSSILTKMVRPSFAAPDLHFVLQAGSAAFGLAVLFFLSGANDDPLFFSTDPVAGALGLFSPQRRDAFLYSGIFVDTLGTMGYVVALAYVDPLVTTLAMLFQPLCAVLEAHVYAGAPLPGPAYLAGAAILFGASSLVLRAQARTERLVDANAAVGRIIPKDGHADGAPPLSTFHNPIFKSEKNSVVVSLNSAARSELLGLWRRAKHGARAHDQAETHSLVDRSHHHHHLPPI
ncbi:hypothetical protein CTAYLR_001141 [Chrysophaeum taylorii]|uniref:EamA domain-containing protein n=1 Tax=Chrysophaeum taylorii TaxID=2483200 RepID=A0AAD7URG5_9STRA|nr:hypothetical protein CTAYLR_001141 [Chrysophaeum taylorii]